jgi:hypothetical protein
MMPHTITVRAPDGTYTSRGQPNLGAPQSYTCYIDPVQGESIVRSASNEERQASYKIYVASTTAINPEGELTLPAGFDPQKPPMLASALIADEDGPHHVVITV